MHRFALAASLTLALAHDARAQSPPAPAPHRVECTDRLQPGGGVAAVRRAMDASESCLYAGRLRDGVRVLDDLLRHPTPKGTLAAVLNQRGKLLAFQAFTYGRGHDEARTALAAAEAAAAESGADRDLGDAKFLRGFAEYARLLDAGPSTFDAPLALFQESLELRRRAGDARGVAESTFWVGLVHERRERFDDALRYYAEALSLARAGGFKLEESYALRHTAAIHQRRRELDAALQGFRESLALREEIRFLVYLPFSYLSVAGVLAAQGRGEEAERYYEQARRSADEIGIPVVATLSRVGMGDLLLARGDTAGAVERFRAAARAASQGGFRDGEQMAAERLRRAGIP